MKKKAANKTTGPALVMESQEVRDLKTSADAASAEVAAITAKRVDPAIRTITIRGTQYKLDMKFAAIAHGEHAINRAGAEAKPPYRINALSAFADRGSLLSTQTLFACALHSHHPEITYPEACDILSDMLYALAIASEMFAYWAAQAEANDKAKPKDAA